MRRRRLPSLLARERWSAVKDPDVVLPDAFELTEWVEGMALGDFSYPDLEGNARALDDPAFAGRARIHSSRIPFRVVISARTSALWSPLGFG